MLSMNSAADRPNAKACGSWLVTKTQTQEQSLEEWSLPKSNWKSLGLVLGCEGWEE